MRRSRGFHDELLEAVLQASIACVTAPDSLGASLIDGRCQRLPATLRVDRARA
jgi:hypothetical protein